MSSPPRKAARAAAANANAALTKTARRNRLTAAEFFADLAKASQKEEEAKGSGPADRAALDEEDKGQEDPTTDNDDDDKDDDDYDPDEDEKKQRKARGGGAAAAADDDDDDDDDSDFEPTERKRKARGGGAAAAADDDDDDHGDDEPVQPKRKARGVGAAAAAADDDKDDGDDDDDEEEDARAITTVLKSMDVEAMAREARSRAEAEVSRRESARTAAAADLGPHAAQAASSFAGSGAPYEHFIAVGKLRLASVGGKDYAPSLLVRKLLGEATPLQPELRYQHQVCQGPHASRLRALSACGVEITQYTTRRGQAFAVTSPEFQGSDERMFKAFEKRGVDTKGLKSWLMGEATTNDKWNEARRAAKTPLDKAAHRVNKRFRRLMDDYLPDPSSPQRAVALAYVADRLEKVLRRAAPGAPPTPTATNYKAFNSAGTAIQRAQACASFYASKAFFDETKQSRLPWKANQKTVTKWTEGIKTMIFVGGGGSNGEAHLLGKWHERGVKTARSRAANRAG